MARGITRLVHLATLACGLALPAAAGVIDDQGRRIRLTYDDADWKSSAGTWPLTCTNASCLSITCTSEGNPSSDNTDKQALRITREIQSDFLLGTDMQVVQKPVVRTFGATKGVYVGYFGKTSSWYSFDFMTLGSAKRVTLSCEGAAADGDLITTLFEELMSTLELY